MCLLTGLLKGGGTPFGGGEAVTAISSHLRLFVTRAFLVSLNAGVGKLEPVENKNDRDGRQSLWIEFKQLRALGNTTKKPKHLILWHFMHVCRCKAGCDTIKPCSLSFFLQSHLH